MCFACVSRLPGRLRSPPKTSISRRCAAKTATGARHELDVRARRGEPARMASARRLAHLRPSGKRPSPSRAASGPLPTRFLWRFSGSSRSWPDWRRSAASGTCCSCGSAWDSTRTRRRPPKPRRTSATWPRAPRPRPCTWSSRRRRRRPSAMHKTLFPTATTRRTSRSCCRSACAWSRAGSAAPETRAALPWARRTRCRWTRRRPTRAAPTWTWATSRAIPLSSARPTASTSRTDGRRPRRTCSPRCRCACTCPSSRRSASARWWRARATWTCSSTAAPAGRSDGWPSVGRTCSSSAPRRTRSNGPSSTWPPRRSSAARTRQPWSKFPTHSGEPPLDTHSVRCPQFPPFSISVWSQSTEDTYYKH